MKQPNPEREARLAKMIFRDKFESNFITCYGFGCMGLGVYVYDLDYNVILFTADKAKVFHT